MGGAPWLAAGQTFRGWNPGLGRGSEARTAEAGCGVLGEHPRGERAGGAWLSKASNGDRNWGPLRLSPLPCGQYLGSPRHQNSFQILSLQYALRLNDAHVFIIRKKSTIQLLIFPATSELGKASPAALLLKAAGAFHTLPSLYTHVATS